MRLASRDEYRIQSLDGNSDLRLSKVHRLITHHTAWNGSRSALFDDASFARSAGELMESAEPRRSQGTHFTISSMPTIELTMDGQRVALTVNGDWSAASYRDELGDLVRPDAGKIGVWHHRDSLILLADFDDLPDDRAFQGDEWSSRTDAARGPMAWSRRRLKSDAPNFLRFRRWVANTNRRP